MLLFLSPSLQDALLCWSSVICFSSKNITCFTKITPSLFLEFYILLDFFGDIFLFRVLSKYVVHKYNNYLIVGGFNFN